MDDGAGARPGDRLGNDLRLRDVNFSIYSQDRGSVALQARHEPMTYEPASSCHKDTHARAG